jgi:hypothetical protein
VDDDGQQNASTDNDIAAAATRSANAAATDAFLAIIMCDFEIGGFPPSHVSQKKVEDDTQNQR